MIHDTVVYSLKTLFTLSLIDVYKNACYFKVFLLIFNTEKEKKISKKISFENLTA